MTARKFHPGPVGEATNWNDLMKRSYVMVGGSEVTWEQTANHWRQVCLKKLM